MEPGRVKLLEIARDHINAGKSSYAGEIIDALLESAATEKKDHAVTANSIRMKTIAQIVSEMEKLVMDTSLTHTYRICIVDWARRLTKIVSMRRSHENFYGYSSTER